MVETSTNHDGRDLYSGICTNVPANGRRSLTSIEGDISLRVIDLKFYIEIASAMNIGTM